MARSANTAQPGRFSVAPLTLSSQKMLSARQLLPLRADMGAQALELAA
jgi:hypothetical protein